MNSIVYIFCCLFSFNIILVTPGLLGVVTSPSSRSRVAVFDIDDTLCTRVISFRHVLDELDNVRRNYPECPIILWTDTSASTYGYNSTYPHIFLPYLQILFDYLLKEDVRIVFFSAAEKKRNLPVIAQLLTSFWGAVKFEALKAKGQFDILSKENMRAGNVSFSSDEGNYVKDLKAVIREGETLSDVILVEDDAWYVAHDQKPFLQVHDLGLWQWCSREKNHTNKALDEISAILWTWEFPDFFLNSVYYILGVFKRYFENKIYKKLPLKEGINQILPEKVDHYFFEANSFAYEMYDLGLSEVQK